MFILPQLTKKDSASFWGYILSQSLASNIVLYFMTNISLKPQA